MKKVLNSEDYDLYHLLIPVSNLFGRKRENYIYKELEKRHPCFSDNFAYEYSSRLTRKGVLCDVTVIDKNILGMYRNKFPKAALYTEENKHILRNRKNIDVFFLLGSAIVSFSIFCGFRFISEKDAVETFQVQETVVDLEENHFCLAESILTDIAECDGTIKSFQWQFDGFSEKSMVHVSGCFPSDFEYSSEKASLIFSSVVFQNGNSEFSINAENKVSGFEFRKEKSFGKRKMFFETLNQWLAENQLTIVNEDYLSGKINVFCSNPKSTLFFEFGKITDQLNKEFGFSLNELRIEKSSMALGFTEDFIIPFDKNIFHCLSEINPHFVKEKEIENVKKIDFRKTENVEKRKKIGSIAHENGEKNTFYINAKGKIENEER